MLNVLSLEDKYRRKAIFYSVSLVVLGFFNFFRISLVSFSFFLKTRIFLFNLSYVRIFSEISPTNHLFVLFFRGGIKTISILQKAFQSYKPSSVTKWIRFIQVFCFLSNTINCQEQLKTIATTNWKEKKMHFLLGSLHYVINSSMWLFLYPLTVLIGATTLFTPLGLLIKSLQATPGLLNLS